MLSNTRLDADRVTRKRSQFPLATKREQIIALSCVLSLSMVCGCIHTDEVSYLSAGEIRESIIGNTLTEAETGRWKEDYLPSGEDRFEGIIRGHQRAPEGPYGGTWSIRGDSMCLKYRGFPEQSDCYRFSRRDGSKILWFNEAGELVDDTKLIERNDIGDVFVESTPQAFRKETVTFQHGNNVLVGELRLPSGPAPYPVVVFVTGAGPVSRHKFAFWPLQAVPNEFLSRGFATFIWSKPGVDESTGHHLKQSMALRAEEVAAAMTHLAARADIDVDRIGLWGESQAGWVMPMVPALRNVAFVIASSCPAQSGIEQTLFSAGSELAIAGISADDRADALEHIRALQEILRIATDYDEYLRDHEEWLAEAARRSWYPTVKSQIGEQSMLEIYFTPMDRELFEHFSKPFANDEPPRLENLKMPVLAIFGSNDIAVDARTGAKAYGEIPLANGNRDVTVKVFEGADHSILLPDTEGYLEFDPGYITLMGEWLAAHR